MLNLSSLSTQSLASCVNYFVWNCLTCFSNTKIGSVTSFFDIVQFSRSCAPQPQRLTTWLFYHRCDFLSSTFFQKLFDFTELVVRFSTYPYWFFRFASAAFRSHSFRRPLALKYNTTSRHVWQPLFSLFSFLFASLTFWLVFQLQFTRSLTRRLQGPQRPFSLYNNVSFHSNFQGSIHRRGYYAPECKHFPCTVCQELWPQILLQDSRLNFGETAKTQNVVVSPLTYH